VSDDEALNPNRPPTVFLSYASADREAARVLKDAMPVFGLEVWYDESELGGGELWDQKIRKQIRDCDYFMPLISAQTEARHEGYFRREWRLAVERTLDMADDHPFLLPVVIDETNQDGARVPEKFFSIQWLRVPGGKPTPGLEALCRRLVSGEAASPKSAAGPLARGGKRERGEGKAPPQYPVMPVQGTGSKTQYWLHLFFWACRSVWVFFNQLPRWVRTLVYIWLFIVVLSRGCTSRDHESHRVAPADADKLNAITEKYHGSTDKKDLSKLAAQIARITSDDDDEAPAERSPLLATPFTAPTGDTEAAKLADSTFALVYGKLVIAHRGRVGLSAVSESCGDLKSAVERGRSNHSTYILCGAIGPGAGSAAGAGTGVGVAAAQVLTIKMAKVSDGAILWSKAYPVAGADSTKIAEEVYSKVPSLEEE
jgi:TIR domain